MALMIEMYTSDGEMLAEIAAKTKKEAVSTDEPELVENAASLDLDLATVGQTIWEWTVAFGDIGGALAAVQTLVGLLGLRKKDPPITTTVEVVVNGAKVTFSGGMTPTEAAARVREFENAARGTAS